MCCCRWSSTPAVAEDAAEGAFDVDTVAGLLVEKLVRRHPHVFADGDAATPDEVETEWERIKAQENAARAATGGSSGEADGTSATAGADLPHGIPATLPVELAVATVLARARRRSLVPEPPARHWPPESCQLSVSRARDRWR
jgi:XTP/dITP diphosphohydrolase